MPPSSTQVGLETAKSLVEHFKKNGFPPPIGVNLPAVELKGFNGKTETTTAGLKWTCCLGNCRAKSPHSWCDAVFVVTKSSGSHGSCFGFETSYTSEKHGLHQTPLRQASNGHLLLPLFTPTVDLEVAKCDHQVQNEPTAISDDVSEPVDIETPVEDMAPPLQKPQHANKGNNRGNKRDTPLDGFKGW